MIITHIREGMGNQMFQYAMGRYLAHKNNTVLKLDISECKLNANSRLTFYRLSEFNIIEDFATDEEIKKVRHIKEIQKNGIIFFMPEIFNAPDNVFIHGYWQSEKYFVEIRDILLREFTLKKPLGKNSTTWKEKILSSKCAVSLHVRHGDYILFKNLGLVPISYYFTCLNEIHKSFSDLTIFVFSDDLKWCKENLKFDVPTEFVEGCEKDVEEMYLMSLCKHNIISNSTFSWWGAWLNQNPNKKVFAPTPWFLSLKVEKNIPESWIKIPVDYYASMLKNLSLIVYVKESADTLGLLLTSCLTQGRNDYEIILIDASTDGSSKICRQVAADEKINILRVDPSTDKFSAWNKGLDIARGDYVLFLTGKDFIFPHTANMVANICDADLKRYANSPETYMTYNTYTNYIPNIICSTQSLEENENGTIGINGIPNKKFSLKGDAAFQNLNGVIELEIPNNQKLIVLANKSIENVVSTKFFKRKFLIENNIKFREGGGMDAELLFLVNAFLATEKITFTPQPFLGRLK